MAPYICTVCHEPVTHYQALTGIDAQQGHYQCVLKATPPERVLAALQRGEIALLKEDEFLGGIQQRYLPRLVPGYEEALVTDMSQRMTEAQQQGLGTL